MRVSPKTRSTKPRNCEWPSPKRSYWFDTTQALSGLQSGEGDGVGVPGAGVAAGEGATLGAGAVAGAFAGGGVGEGLAVADGLGAGSGACAAAPAAARSTASAAASVTALDHIRRHAHDVEPAVDVEDLARDPAREARDEEQRGVADFFLLGVLAQRRVRAMVFEHLRDPVDAGGGDGLD